MDNNEYNVYAEYNQANTPANDDLIDLSSHSSHAYNVLTQEEGTQDESGYNKVIRTKGARKIILDQRRPAYESTPSKMQKQFGNYTLQARSGQMETFRDLAAIEVPSEEENYAREIISHRIDTYDDVSSFGTHNEDDNSSKSDEIDENYSALDDSTMTKIQKYSEINKAIINNILKKLSVVMLPNLAQQPNAVTSGKCVLDSKALQALVSSVLEIVRNGPHISMKKSMSNKSTQTEIIYKEPPHLENKGTQTVTESVPRVKINTHSNKIHLSKDLKERKEQDALYFHNLQTSNQNSNVYDNQQEQFYDNRELFPQLQMDAAYAVQTSKSSRNNVQPPMMQYGMPYTASAMMQRTESGNNGVQMVTQYGLPQATNTMIQRAEEGMNRMQQVTQPRIPQHDPSFIQRADVSRNRMQRSPRVCHRANTSVTATVHPTYYDRRNPTNVPRHEIPRTQPLMMQTVPRTTAVPSQVRGRVSRPHDYYANATNPSNPRSAQWQIPGYQDQFRNN